MFTRLYIALFTPFLTDLSPDINSITKLVKMQFQSRVDEIIIFGTSGEGMTVTDSEKIVRAKINRNYQIISFTMV